MVHVTISELKVNAGKYIELAESEEVVITKYGKPAAKIINFVREPWYLKSIPDDITSIEQLFGTLPGDIDLEDVRMERLRK